LVITKISAIRNMRTIASRPLQLLQVPYFADTKFIDLDSLVGHWHAMQNAAFHIGHSDDYK